MGCKQSKATNEVVSPPPADAGQRRKSKGESPRQSKKKSQKIRHNADLYHYLLSGLNTTSPQDKIARSNTESFWEEAQRLCSSDTSLATYIDPDTHGTPLHVACSLGSANVKTNAVSSIANSCIKTIIDAFPEAVGLRDKHGKVPLEGIFSGMCAEKDVVASSSLSASFSFRIETSRLLLEKDSVCVKIRGEILYQVIESLPDDAEAPLGPTVEFIKLLVEKGGASVQAPSESMDDDVLALLYRRFVRQFDQSEKFFEGDNSRNEVVQHRLNFKNAAVNTFNIIELLLRQPHVEEDNLGDMLVHNAVRVGSCPPDLLRYIVETNLEAVSVADILGNLPLHYAAGYCDTKSSSPECYSKYVIDELLYAYPEGSSVPNADGNLPIVLAIESGKKWIGGGIRSLHDAYPDGINQANLGEQHPLNNSMSLLSQEDDQSDIAELLEEQDDGEGTIATGVDGGGGRRRKRRQRRKINKDERHDAIMFVQKPDSKIRDVITTMWANEEDGGVQMLGCSAIELAAKDAGCEEAIVSVALLGVTTVVNAMKNHPNEPAVQEKACAALNAMSPADGMREVSFAASGAISTVVNAMQAHLQDASVQREACKALRGIVAKGGAERATVVASVSGFTAILNSMGAHDDDKTVQCEACATLDVLTSFSDAYIPELHGGQIETLLQSAGKKFPDDCSQVDAILSRLK